MFVRLFFFFLAMLSPCFAMAAKNNKINEHKSKNQPYDEVVSLGARCQVANQIEANGIRQRAYPFDWIVTNAQGLGAFITNKGSHFLDKDKIIYVGPYPGSPPHYHVIDTHYGFESFHEFLAPETPGNYEGVKAKLERRIRRFFKLLESDKKVLFIRTDTTKADAVYLDNIIHTLYPHLVYTIVALGNTPDHANEWGLPRIKNFYINIDPSNWEGDYVRWKEILRTFKITPTSKNRSPEERW